MLISRNRGWGRQAHYTRLLLRVFFTKYQYRNLSKHVIIGTPYKERRKRIMLVITACGIEFFSLKTWAQWTKSCFLNNLTTVVLPLLKVANVSQPVIACKNSMWFWHFEKADTFVWIYFPLLLSLPRF